MNHECFTDAELAKLLLPESEQSEFWSEQLAHLETCHKCATRLEKLSVSPFPNVMPPDVSHEMGNVTLPGSNDLLAKLRSAKGDRTFGMPSLPGQPGTVEPARQNQTEGEELAHYQLIEKIGSGGMGSVYRAIDRKLNRTVAIKLISSEHKELCSRLISHEALAAAQVEHPNVIPVYSIEEVADQHFLVMQFVEGENLQTLMLKHREKSAEDWVRLCLDIAFAMQYAHEKGVVHRDIKPANVIVEFESGAPKIGDFGLAMAVGSKTRNLSGGTPGFLSPEIKAGATPSVQSDIYALGVTLYQCLVGRPDFDRLRLAPVSKDLAAVVAKATHPDLSQRYESMADFASDLRRWLDGGPVSALPHSVGKTFLRFLNRNRTAVAVTASFLVVLAAGVALVQSKENSLQNLSEKQTTTTARLNAAENEISKRDQRRRQELEMMADEAWESRHQTTRTTSESLDLFRQRKVKLAEAVLKGAIAKADLTKLADAYVRAARDCIVANQTLKAVGYYEKAISTGLQISDLSQAEPMTRLRLLRICRDACELNLDNDRLEAARESLEQFDVLFRKIEFEDPEFNNRLRLQAGFRQILEAQLAVRENRIEEANGVLNSLRSDLQTLSSYDFSKSFISNRHRIDLHVKLASCMFASGNEQAAVDLLGTFASEYSYAGNQEQETEFDFQAWEQSVDYLLQHGQLELAAIANQDLIEVVELWGEPAKARPRVMETLEAAIRTAAILEPL